MTGDIVMSAEILIAEDEAMLRAIAVETLEFAGFEVLQASNGGEALELLDQNEGVKLLISDVKMPVMDGYALAEAAMARHPGLKIVLMTGYGHEPPVEFLRRHDIEILHKPFDLELLADKARSRIPKSGAAP
jgi:DNA-binding NtrC family response regulator